MKNKIKYIASLLFILLLPVTVFAQDLSIAEMLKNILNFLLGIFALLAVIGFVVSGLMYITSSGDEAQAEKAKKIMVYTAIGLVIGLISYSILITINGMLSGI